MNKREQMKTVFLYSVFICYIILLFRILLFSRIDTLLEILNGERALVRSINLIPFHTIVEYVSGQTENLRRFAYGNVIGNIIAFVPLGFYLPTLKKEKGFVRNLLLVSAVSLFVEIIQGIFAIGAADIDDLILNTIGGCIGILSYKFLTLILMDSKKIDTASILLSAAALPVILYYLFMIKMRF